MGGWPGRVEKLADGPNGSHTGQYPRWGGKAAEKRRRISSKRASGMPGQAKDRAHGKRRTEGQGDKGRQTKTGRTVAHTAAARGTRGANRAGTAESVT